MVQRSNRFNVRRKGISPKILLLLIGALAAYALWIGGRPNEHYAQVFYQQGNDCEACPLTQQILLAEKAIYHDPAFSNGYTRLGYLFTKDHRSAEAIAFHQEAILLDHRNRFSLIALGIYHFQRQDLDRALRYLMAAQAVTGYGDSLNYYLGRIFERKGDVQKASWHYLRAYQFNPQNMNALARMGSIDYRNGDKKSCLKVAQELRAHGQILLSAELEAFTKTDGKTEFLASEK